MARPRIAVVSPFIDRRHGTERRVAECIERLAGDYEIHVYSNRVEDVHLHRIVWRRVPALPGPHLFAYLWWLAANHVCRWSDRWFRNLRPEVVYSPGINCLDADVISVHVVFARLRENVQQEMRLLRNPIGAWPQLIHRRIYYRLIQYLERKIYPSARCRLGVVSAKVAEDLHRYYGRTDHVQVIYGGLDVARFNPERRTRLRAEARKALGLEASDFAILLIGNGWKNKGLQFLLEAVGSLQNSQLVVLVAGRDDSAPYQPMIKRYRLSGRVKFLGPRPDVEFFYAAADAYVGPSLEDAFAQPPAEAMACGLPVVTSRNNGGAEMISHGVDGLILENPADCRTLADWIRRLSQDEEFRRSLSRNAARTARKFTWEENAAKMKLLFEQARQNKQTRCASRREALAERK